MTHSLHILCASCPTEVLSLCRKLEWNRKRKVWFVTQHSDVSKRLSTRLLALSSPLNISQPSNHGVSIFCERKTLSHNTKWRRAHTFYLLWQSIHRPLWPLPVQNQQFYRSDNLTPGHWLLSGPGECNSSSLCTPCPQQSVETAQGRIWKEVWKMNTIMKQLSVNYMRGIVESTFTPTLWWGVYCKCNVLSSWQNSLWDQ